MIVKACLCPLPSRHGYSTPSRYLRLLNQHLLLISRPDGIAGRLEKLSTARHALGIYRWVTVTCRYRFPELLGTLSLRHTIYLALREVIARHAALSCAICGEDTETPVFKRLQSIDLRHVVQWSSVDGPDQLTSYLAGFHDEMLDNIDVRPPWEIILCQNSKTDGPSNTLHIAFRYHHALADGMSGVTFHQSLQQELRRVMQTKPEDRKSSTEVEISPDTQLTSPIEDLIKLPLSWEFLARQVLEDALPRWLSRKAPAPWAGEWCRPLKKLPYKTRLRVLTIPAETVDRWLKAAREEKTTLTSLIVGLVVFSLARQLPEAERFVDTTPYSMRPYTGTSNDEIVNQASAFDTSYDESILRRIRVSSAESIVPVWDMAHRHQSNMKEQLAKCPRDNIIGLLPYISDYQQFFKKKMDRPRDVTFEVSNLGAFKPSESEDMGGAEKDACVIEDMLFSQGAAATACAFGVNCASVRGGPLNLCFSWQEGVIDESIIDGIVKAFEDLPVR